LNIKNATFKIRYELVKDWSCGKNFSEIVKLSRYTPWRHMGGEEV
jgi:hypothetical protein